MRNALLEKVGVACCLKQKKNMSLEQTACEDLKAFERRLTEVVSCAQPAATRWREATSLAGYVFRGFCRGLHWFGLLCCLLLSASARFCFVILLLVSMFTAMAAYYWLSDPHTSMVSFTDSLVNHPFFAISSVILGFLFLTGVHKRVIAPSILTTRTRQVLADFNMSCDDTGKLILRPRPVPT